LPDYIAEDIDVSFRTFCSHTMHSAHLGNWNQTPCIPASMVGDALRYAGIYNTALNPIKQDTLNRAEFGSLCLRALLTPLSNTMVANILEFFKKHQAEDYDPNTGESGVSVDRSDLVVLFKDIFNFDIPASDVDGVANMWGASLAHRIDSTAFIAIVSRFLRINIFNLCMLKGIRELMGKEMVTDGDRITTEMIMKAEPQLTRFEAEEMIFFADFCDGESDGKSLDFRMAVAVLNCATDDPVALPPPPHVSDSPTSVPVTELTGTLGGQSTDEWLRNAVVDFRRPFAWSPPAKRGRSLDNEAAIVEVDSDPVEKEPLADTFKARMLLLLDEPESSVAANNLSVVMGMMILVSVLTLFLEPLISPKGEPISEGEKRVWFGFEAFFTGLFTIEYLLNFLVCDALGTQTKLQFLKEPMRICDMVAVLPFYIDQTIDMDQEEFRLFRIARLMRLSRLIRLGRLAKRSATFAPIAMILVVIWGIYMKNGLKE